MTWSLQTYGAFHWTEISKMVSKDSYELMQLQRENRVWLVDLAYISPKPRRSILDYVNVSNIDSKSMRFPLIKMERPAAENVVHMTCSTTGMAVEARTLTHTIDGEALKEAPPDFMQMVVESLYSEITLSIEKALYNGLLNSGQKLAANLSMEKQSDPMTIVPELPLNAERVVEAAIAISTVDCRVPCPDGLVCFASPAQAMQLVDTTESAKSMNICGVDLLATPEIKFDTSHDRYAAFVSAKQSIHVALSPLEIDTDQNDAGTRIVAKYAVGLSFDPEVSAKIVSWRK